MRRREFLIGTIGAAWPWAGLAQQLERSPRVGVLIGGIDDGTWESRLSVFKRQLELFGWKVGHNVRLDVRWGKRDPGEIASQAKQLVDASPDVILAAPSNAVIPLLRETRNIPVVFVQVSDPLGQGIIDSLARPSGNVTGFSNLDFGLIARWLHLIKEVTPQTTRVAMILSTTNAASTHWFRVFNEVARSVAIEPMAAPVNQQSDVEHTIEDFARSPKTALIVPGDILVSTPSVRRLLIQRTTSLRLPTIFGDREFAVEGGLLSYGIHQPDQYRGAASYIDRILRGVMISELPVQQPTKFELVVNLKTARMLDILVPLAGC